jgi:hypothetical protein
MPEIPANFPCRTELQSLILRASDLVKASHGELPLLLTDLVTAASNIEGFLADLAVTHGQHAVYRSVLENPNGWEAAWAESTCMLHTRKGVFYVKIGQQILKANGNMIGTGRYRIMLGEPAVVTISTNQQLLRQLVEKYLQEFEDVIPESLRENVLDHYFVQTDDRPKQE